MSPHPATRSPPRRGLRFLLCVAALDASAHVAADELVLEPVADTTLYEDAPDDGTGASTFLFVGPLASGSPRRILLRFDLSSLPSGAVVTAANLQLTVNRAAFGASATDAHSLHRVLASWGEGSGDGGTGGAGGTASANDATWTRRFHGTPPSAPGPAWSTSGGDVAAPSAQFPLGGAGRHTVQSTPGLLADIRQWQAEPTSNFGWQLRGPEGPSLSQKARRVVSRDSASVAERPRLVVTYDAADPPAPVVRPVPLPPWAPLALALLCLGGVRRAR